MVTIRQKLFITRSAKVFSSNDLCTISQQFFSPLTLVKPIFQSFGDNSLQRQHFLNSGEQYPQLVPKASKERPVRPLRTTLLGSCCLVSHSDPRAPIPRPSVPTDAPRSSASARRNAFEYTVVTFPYAGHQCLPQVSGRKTASNVFILTVV